LGDSLLRGSQAVPRCYEEKIKDEMTSLSIYGSFSNNMKELFFLEEWAKEVFAGRSWMFFAGLHELPSLAVASLYRTSSSRWNIKDVIVSPLHYAIFCTCWFLVHRNSPCRPVSFIQQLCPRGDFCGVAADSLYGIFPLVVSGKPLHQRKVHREVCIIAMNPLNYCFLSYRDLSFFFLCDWRIRFCQR